MPAPQMFVNVAGNLLVDANWTVKVADFGLARALESVAPLTGGLGTFQWMAPEVLARQAYSAKADVYAFGIVVWETCARQVHDRSDLYHCLDNSASLWLPDSADDLHLRKSGKVHEQSCLCKQCGVY